MTNEKHLLIAEKLASDTRMPATNSFTNCAQACLSEWLQFLMVVERIKANKNGALTSLNALVSLAEQVYQSPQVIDYVQENIFQRGMRNDGHWNPQPCTDRLRLNVLRTLFTTLDAGQSQSMYLTQIGKTLRDSTRDPFGSRYEKIVCELIPGLLDSLKFPWQNLNLWRLHYPHEAITGAMMFHSAMMDALFDLREWIEMPYLEMKKQALLKLLDRGEINISVQDKIPSAAQINFIREKMHELIAIGLVKRINALPAAIGLNTNNPLQNPDFPLSVSKGREKLTFSMPSEPAHEQEVITLKFNADTLRKCADSGELAVFYMTLEQKLASVMYDEKKYNTTNFYSSQERLPTPVWSALQSTLRWTRDDYFMLPMPSGSRVNEIVMLAGLEFSHWLWQERRKGKLTTSQAVKMYSAQRAGITTTNASTIKQYYERMRSWCKAELVATIKHQLSSRSENFTLIKLNLIWPINIDLIKRYNDFLTILSNLTNERINDRCNVDEIIFIASSLRALLLNVPEGGQPDLVKFICEQLNVDSPENTGLSFKDLTYERSVLQKLVELNIDIGWGE